MVPHGIGPVGAVEQKRSAGGRQPQDVLFLQEMELVAADEIRRADQIGRMDRARPEAQMRDRLRARLVRIVDEVALRIETGVFGDDLHAVLVRAYRAIGAEPVENRAHHVVGLNRPVRIERETGMRDIVVDADGEAVLRIGLREFVEYGLRHGRIEILRRQPVAAADDAGHDLPMAARDGLCECFDDVEIKRLAGSAGLLGLLDHRDRAAFRRQGGEEMQG